MTDKNNLDEPQLRQKVAIYVRVSTVYQVDKDSLPMQKKDLISYSELILGISNYEIFEDAGYSGKNTDRPAYQEMMLRVNRGEFSHVLVWKIDRISRNLMDFSEMYLQLKKLRVVFVSKNEQFDTSSAIGEAMLKIILVFAELERNMTAERVTATMINRASQGQWNGGRIPYGYDYDYGEGKFTIREDEASVCRLIVEDYIKNRSITHTSRMLNQKGYTTRAGCEWSNTAVWIIAQSPFYAGIYRYNRYKGTSHRTKNDPDEWIMVENHHPAIITAEERAQILAIMEENARVKNTSEQHNTTKNVYVFGRICYCGKCGTKMTATTGRVQKDGYRTAIYSCPRRVRTHDCTNTSTNDLIIGEFVINYISNIISAKMNFSQIKSPHALQERLLFGNTFCEVKAIEESGLNELYNLLSRYKSDSTFSLISKPRRQKAEVDPEVAILRRDRDKQERALKRLQELYLYEDEAIPEKDYILKRSEITAKIEEINRKLGLKQAAVDNTMSDEDFIKKASHLLINSRLQSRGYIYYKNLALSTSPDILKEYVTSLVDSIQLTDSHVTSITFKNGITHKFIYA